MAKELTLPDATLPVLDDAVLSREFGDSPEILAELRDLFKQQVTEVNAELCAAVAAADAVRLARAAHHLKGACVTYGALRLAAVCAELEQLGKQAALDVAADYLAVLASEGERVVVAITGLTDP